MTPVRYTSSR